MNRNLRKAMWMQTCIIVAGLLMGALCAPADAKVPPGEDQEQRYSISQTTSGLAGLWVSDKKTQETIALVSGEKANGSYIAFYAKPNDTWRSMPRLAISSEGLQIVKDKRLYTISLDELITLDSSGGSKLGGAYNPERGIAADASCSVDEAAQ